MRKIRAGRSVSAADTSELKRLWRKLQDTLMDFEEAMVEIEDDVDPSELRAVDVAFDSVENSLKKLAHAVQQVR